MKFKYETTRNLVFYTILLIVVVSAAVIWNSSHENMAFDSEAVYEMNEGWQYRDKDGTVRTANLPTVLEAGTNQSVSISYQLPDIDGLRTLSIRTSLQSIQVYVERDLIYSFGIDEEKRMFGQNSGTAWNIIELPEHAAGKQITIQITSPYQYIVGILREVYGGTKSSILFHIMKQHGISLLAAGIILIIGVILLALYIIFRKVLVREKGIKYLGWFAILIAIWLIGESKTTQFFIGNQMLVLYMNYVSLTLFPIPIVQYICSFQNFRYKILMECFNWILCTNAMVVMLLQLFNVVDFFYTAFVTHFLLVSWCVVIMTTLILELFKYHNHEVRYFAISFGGICVSFFLELIYYYYLGDAAIGKFFLVGILFFMLILSVHVLKKAIHIIDLSKHADHYRRLANTDLMTHCKNRTAYTTDLNGITDGQGMTIILADINNLKKINDIHGHHLGDEAIISAGKCLQKAFHQNSTCYRIGGDEFICILHHWEQSAVKEGIVSFIEACEEENERLAFEFQVAAGYAMYDGDQDEQITDTIKRADKNMYSTKDEMKE